MAGVGTKSALLWATMDKFITNGFALVISIVLARLIAPSEFGIIATAMIFTVLLSLFVEPGMTSALIQKKDPDVLDFSTILTFNLCTGAILYSVLFILAPFVTNWFELPILKDVLRVMGLQILIGSVNSVQIAYAQKNMQFKRFFFCSFLSTIISAGIALIMACAGYGVWALVANNICRSFILLITVTIAFRWQYSFKFSSTRLKEMFPFASKMLLAKFIDQGYVEVTQTIISKMYTPTDLAFYNRAKSFPDMLISNLNLALGNVLFPVFSNIQDDESKLKESIINSIRLTSYISFPILIGLLFCAHNLIIFLLTDKWEGSIIFLQILCLYYMWVPFSNIVWLSFKAIGASNRVLQLELIKISTNVVMLIAFVLMMKSSLAIALSLVCSYFLSFIIEIIYVVKFLGINFKEILISFMPSLILSLIMGVGVLGVGIIIQSPVIGLFLQIAVGLLIYISLSVVLRIPQFETIMAIMLKNRYVRR